MPRYWVILSLVALSLSVSAQQGSLSDEEVSTAIQRGREGNQFSVRVGRISGTGTPERVRLTAQGETSARSLRLSPGESVNV
jgi:hypothetical protein